MSNRQSRQQDDRIYYQATTRVRLSQSLALAARKRIFALFVEEMTPGAETTIIDIGTSDYESPEANILEKLYPWPENITCATIGDPSGIGALHPKVKSLKVGAGEPLPFRDLHFDIAYSNAVLEHVGGRAQRREFIAEALRVARAVFIVVPNRWFPVEHHTNMPLLHFRPSLFRSVFTGSRLNFWTHPENLEFLGKRQLAREWPPGRPVRIRYTGLPAGPFSSNVALISR